MLFAIYCPLFYVLFVTALGASAKLDVSGRRGLGQTKYGRNLEGMTPAQQYARTLTLRKPTRRSTAQRRQESPEPRLSSNRVSSLAVENAETGATVGNLVYESEAWKVSRLDSASAITFTGNPTATSQRQRRLVLSSTDVVTMYTNVGVGQCNVGDEVHLKKGSANVLCLVNAVASGTFVGSTPKTLATNMHPSGDSVAETDIWSLNFETGIATPEWINPDGTTVSAQLVVAKNDPSTIYVTADIEASSQALGLPLVAVTIKFALGG
ncbi:hypothetical protein D9613_011445 [Agrocybe pediades]|uniref:Uncharacterized protein n=1 Tax=Agrocybe pediades TaxID=84607 RepID=A0A8H4VMI2_9AGAR|nr:hypothetical protein D9613_011445 [Agrocybe pediades]